MMKEISSSRSSRRRERGAEELTRAASSFSRTIFIFCNENFKQLSHASAEDEDEDE